MVRSGVLVIVGSSDPGRGSTSEPESTDEQLPDDASMKVAVLGAGVTGLTAAHLLSARGHEVRCLEAAERPGGLCRSEVIDGFVADRAGGHILFSKDREVMGFILETIAPVGHHTSRRQTFIFHRGRYIQYPFENGLAGLPPEENFACVRGYIESVFARRNGAPPPENFHDWCLWRFGPGICDLFMHPYNRKIWNVDLHELGTQWVQGRVPDAPMEDVLRSALGIRTEGYAHQAVFHYPLEGGFETLVRCLLRRIPEGVVRTGTPCRSVRRKDGAWWVNGERFDRVVSTLPLPELPRIIDPPPPDVLAAFQGLDHVSLLTVFIALDKADPPPHSWIYFAHPEDGPQNRVTWLGNYSPRNAPPGRSSVMAEVTYHRELPGTEDAVAAEVIDGLARCGLFEKRQVLFHRNFRNNHAYILYRRDLEPNLEIVREHCRSVGLDILGRFGNYSYFNSDMCIRAAMDYAGNL